MRHHLGNLIEKYKAKVVAEVGVFRCSTANENIQDCGEQLDCYYCIDPWMDYGLIGQQQTDDKKLLHFSMQEWSELAQNAYKWALEYPKVKIVRLTSIEAASIFPSNFFDIVYIDGNHGYLPVLQDCLAWLPKIKDNGVISGHDYTGSWLGVVKAVNEIFGGEHREIGGGGGWAVELNSEKKGKYIQKIGSLLK